MTRTPLLRSKGQRSRSPGRFTHRGVNASASCSGDRGNVLAVGTYCYVAVCRRGRLGGARQFGAHRGRRGAGHIVAAASLQLVYYYFLTLGNHNPEGNIEKLGMSNNQRSHDLANYHATEQRQSAYHDRASLKLNWFNNNNNNNTSICKAHNVSIRAESEAPHF